MKCLTCAGSGAHPIQGEPFFKVCPVCNGAGKVRGSLYKLYHYDEALTIPFLSWVWDVPFDDTE